MTKLSTILAASLILLIGCGQKTERQHDQEMACIQATGDKYCRNEYEQQASSSRRYGGGVQYPPTGVGSYHNYYGNPQYGSWGGDGRYHFNNPNSIYATQTNSFLLGAGLGGLAAYAITKSSWNKKNPNGWKDSVRKVDKPLGKDGKVISNKEYKKRLAQSKRDKAKNLKNKSKSSGKVKSTNKGKINLSKKNLSNKKSPPKGQVKPKFKSSYSKPKNTRKPKRSSSRKTSKRIR